MRTFLASLLLVSTLAPLAPTANAVDACSIDCIELHPCYYATVGSVCVQATVDCITASGAVYSQTVTVYRRVPGQSFTTSPVDVGPVHVSSVTVSTDAVTVGPYSATTPGRSFSNTFCQGQVLA